MHRGTSTRRLSAGWAALLLVALAVRAMVPVGWMPSATGFGLVLCGDMAMPSFAEIARQRDDGAPIEIAIARAAMARAEGKGDPPTPDADDRHPCAFAGVAAGLPTPAATGAAPLVIAFTDPIPLRRIVSVGRGLPAPPPPSTGPPATA